MLRATPKLRGGRTVRVGERGDEVARLDAGQLGTVGVLLLLAGGGLNKKNKHVYVREVTMLDSWRKREYIHIQIHIHIHTLYMMS